MIDIEKVHEHAWRHSLQLVSLAEKCQVLCSTQGVARDFSSYYPTLKETYDQLHGYIMERASAHDLSTVIECLDMSLARCTARADAVMHGHDYAGRPHYPHMARQHFQIEHVLGVANEALKTHVSFAISEPSPLNKDNIKNRRQSMEPNTPLRPAHHFEPVNIC